MRSFKQTFLSARWALLSSLGSSLLVFVFFCCSTQATAQIVGTGGGNPQPIPAVGTGGFPCVGGPSVSTAALGGAFPAGSVLGAIDVPGSPTYVVSVAEISLTHTFDDDLEMDLISPAGTVWDLSSDNGGAGNDFINTQFVDGQPSITTGAAPFTGQFEAEEGPFATAFDGQNPDGNWTLSICDDAGGDTGQLDLFQISFEPVNNDCVNATVLPLNTTFVGAIDGSSNSVGLPACGAVPDGPGVYYSFVGAGGPMTVTTSLPETNFDTEIGLYSGTCGAFTCIDGNDDDPNGGLTSRIDFNSIAGQNYILWVEGFGIGQGTFGVQAQANCPGPPNAVCSNFNAVLSATNPGTATIVAANIDGGTTSDPDCGVLTLAIEAGDQTTFTCADVGPGNQVVVTLVATNSAGSSTCDATITTLDETNPTPVCQPFTAQLDANGVATVNLADVLASASDNCDLQAGGQVSQDAFNCAEQGANNVTVTVTDVNGNSGNCTAVVTVEDAIPPVAVCQDITIQLDVAGNAAIVGADLDGGSTDNCPGLTFSAAPNTFTCADVGGNTVVLTVTDSATPTPNSSTCQANVTVEDNITPVANCQNATIMLDANGMATADPNAVNNGSTDACLPLTFALNQTEFDCDDIGANPVILTVTDANGNSSTCTADIIVQDNIPAVILCRPNVNTVNDQGLCGADVILLPPLVIEENCSIANVARNPAPGVIFPVGTTLVTWTLTDAGGNDTQCVQNVTINDTEDPVVDCGNSFIAYTSWDNCGYPSYLLEGATATDNCGVVTFTNDAPNFFPPGQYMVNYTATDAAGNEATCMQWVKIYDTTKPKLTSCPEDIEVEATTTDGANATWSLPTGMDNCPGPIILVEANGHAPGDFFELGEHDISYRLYDQNGQFVECEFTVTVVPIGALSLDLNCMPDLEVALENAMGWNTLGWNPPLIDGNCDQCDVLASDDFELIGTLSGHQYYTYTADELTWAEAMTYAEDLGVSIAVLEDKKEVPMIENEMPEGNYFIGLIDEEGTGDFKWINGDEYVLSDFGVEFENDSEKPAVVILNEEGEWEVVILEDATADFVFEKVCVELEMEIEEGDDDETPELADPNTTAEVIYTAVDECGNVSTCGFEVVLAAEAVAYCEPTGIATDEEHPYFIESFSLNGYTVETGDDEGYGDHTDEHFLFTPGEVLDMHTEFAGPGIDELPMYCRIWMDLNNDGDFFDEGELLMQGVDIKEAVAELTIPNLNQSVENTVMRIAISRLTYAESCGDFLNGEVEDYTISIIVPEDSQEGQNGASITSTLGADMFVYPNPAQDELFVKLKNMDAETATLSMYNSVGQLVATQKVAANSTVRLDISDYTNGLYSVTAEANGEVRLTQKFIVEK